MVSLHAALLAALLVAAPPGPGEVALAPAPPRGLGAVLSQTLPAPPDVVVRETSRYGTITIDHRQHLALRVSCRRCHGAGVVSKVEFTPQVAHERCVGCHQEGGRGPTHCGGCHVKALAPRVPEGTTVTSPDAPRASVATAAAEEPPASAETAPSPAPPREGADAGGAAGTGPAPPVTGDAGARDAPAAAPGPPSASGAAAHAASAGEPSVRSGAGTRPALLELGCTAGAGFGASLRLASVKGGFLRSYSLDRVTGGSAARMIMLLGLGVLRPLHPRLDASASAVVGFDAQERPRLGFAPTLGARLGLEWSAPPAWPLRSFRLSLTAVTDVARDAIGVQAEGPRLYATVGTAFPPPTR